MGGLGMPTTFRRIAASPSLAPRVLDSCHIFAATRQPTGALLMPPKIDWLYFRKSCTTCKNARGFLDKNEIPVKEITDANKNRKGRSEALALAQTVTKIIVVKGKKQATFDLKKAPPDDDTLANHLLGPTGNLRAPTARVGKTLYVGFNPEMYEGLLTSAQ